MQGIDVYGLIERMAALIRSEERKKCAELGLQPVHVQVLDYLSRCNKYSDTPAATSKYLGMTRGTVSQSLILLEKRGFIEKTSDSADKRVIHLHLLPEGLNTLKQAQLSELFNKASDLLNQHHASASKEIIAHALAALQKANSSQSFGLCKTCQHFTKTPTGFVCGLTKEKLSNSDSEKICQEHTLV